MIKNLRILKASPEGKLPRTKIRKALSAIHVFRSRSGDQWKVRGISPVGLQKTFPSKESAVAFANTMAAEKHVDVLVHNRNARLKVGIPEKAIYQVVFDER